MQLQLRNGSLDYKPKFIKADILQRMRQPHSVSNPGNGPLDRPTAYGYGYGLGTFVDGTGHVRWSHSGAFLLGVATNVVFVPAGDIAIAVLTNGEPHGIAAVYFDLKTRTMTVENLNKHGLGVFISES